jgi:hypothetical protein
MSGKRKLIRNAPLEKGDSVICVKMDDPYSPIPPGMAGVVTDVNEVFGEKQYGVKWKSGSRLALIEGVDYWMKVEQPEQKIEESQLRKKVIKLMVESSKTPPQDFVRLRKFYDIWKIYEFFNALRESSVINMFGASPYLYMGKDRIEHQHYYDNFDEEKQEKFDIVLDMADEMKNMMISGAMKHLESKKTDKDSDRYIRNVESTIKRDATELLKLWTKLKGGSQFMK